MARFAANLSMMYTEHDFLDRFQAAADDGYDAVEFMFPYPWPASGIAARLRAAGLRQVLFNAPPGDYAAGERGLAGLPGRREDFRDSILRALEYAEELDCPRLHVMAGVVPAGAARESVEDVYRENLAWAAAQAAPAGRDLLIEPINTRDMPGYFLNRQAQAHAMVEDVGAANLKVQMDLYHCQIVEGDLETRLRAYLPTGRVGHVQIAGVPRRQEPDTGEVNYPHLFGVLDELAYDGWIGCEYRPRAGTSAGLGWLRAWQAGAGRAAG
ncbi:2-oxo-tetronate isomerase [Achromobacter aloeverae]|uniref:Hydroxypyruvate isomerase n=1 Tax=Achromobacter aloeverae TaxID=1750518 RepID=A0A4Q1HEM8_9BURK|nr:2-oxo-tetronate isomerase [Achromobacter aloeverae]RXN83850.1 hydroxypyruvate isomerase [Achromobacter aloeverae]